jgi:hypothetical protein
LASKVRDSTSGDRERPCAERSLVASETHQSTGYVKPRIPRQVVCVGRLDATEIRHDAWIDRPIEPCERPFRTIACCDESRLEATSVGHVSIQTSTCPGEDAPESGCCGIDCEEDRSSAPDLSGSCERSTASPSRGRTASPPFGDAPHVIDDFHAPGLPLYPAKGSRTGSCPRFAFIQHPCEERVAELHRTAWSGQLRVAAIPSILLPEARYRRTGSLGRSRADMDPHVYAFSAHR